jgi:hypothetical protein
MQSVPSILNIILCNKVCQLLTVDLWFSQSTTVSSTNKTDRHVITEILFSAILWRSENDIPAASH